MDILDRDIQYLKGVGPKKAYLLNKLNIKTFKDMIWHFPRDYEDRGNIRKIAQLIPGEKTTFYGYIYGEAEISKPKKNMSLIKFIVKDETGQVEIVFFNKVYLKKAITSGQRVMINGEVKKTFKGMQIVNPVLEKINQEEEEGRHGIVPIYPSTEGLSQNEILKIQRDMIRVVKESIVEYLPDELIKKHKLCHIQFALENIHFPNSVKSLKIAKYRLVFEEFLFLQLGLLKIKKDHTKEKEGIVLKKKEGIEEFIESLPFTLTAAQDKVVKEICQDLERDIPMNRLVQGDVGSGKTIVAIIALFKAVINGYQGAMMAPTEILAEQHYLSLTDLLSPFGIHVGLLVGSLSKSEKNKILNGIETGEINIVVGTHALIQEGVNFANLSLVITDEQHRFGVRQRSTLTSKGNNPHVLVMTATPIPRTLALILYGDLDISIIDHLPPGRKCIKTYSRTSNKRKEIYNFLGKQLDEGRQAYVVCPLVEESEAIDAQSATEIAEELSCDLLKGYKVGLLHGKMPPKDKEEIMKAFKEGNIQVLVSTTVIEVGVNVPNATMMVVENAERFGLAQLHQLRGRVGRGSHQSYCILINNSKSEISKARMAIMEKTTDGFVISEKDLELRGPGEFFGTRQHGLPELKIANLFKHLSVLKTVQAEVESIAEEDFSLTLDKYPILKRKIELEL
ncbi:ATP-dependent DNA helicase RecG [Alkaliphilus oremlandii]|uniref:ATP-dependent DNA helicase RecG n=1 Tax=Alkaliphilus oremlandii (strain OhILAs) TaxID=350688 RepID=A8MH98_ALKOO|nr:ATP-dependent DNA helicase RecG [Alkaliphilus oremlandii]ABW18985.1 ATP-dependent DNA helicase RecG [Alkaliphilus oremlandii OhILAs]